MYACLGITCHLHFWQNDRGLLRATTVTLGGTDTELESAHEVNSREENSPAASAGTRTRNLWITSPALYQQATPPKKKKKKKERKKKERKYINKK